MIKYKLYCKKNNLNFYEKYKNIFNKNMFIRSEHDFDVNVVIGGDGSLLYAIHEINKSKNKKPILAFNSGNLGFLIPFEIIEIDNILKKFSSLKKINIYLNFIEINNIIYPFFNDVVISNMNIAIDCELKINNFLSTSQKVSGYIISSNLGSIAFNKSLNGPLAIDFSENDKIITPIAPINNLINHGFHNSIITNKDFLLVIKTNTKAIIDGLVKINDVKKVKSCKQRLLLKMLTLDKNYLIKNINKKILK